MKKFCLVLLALTGCAHSPELTSKLDGRWKLTDIRCATGTLGQLGQRIANNVRDHIQDEVYSVKDGAVTWTVLEHKGSGEDPYCETIFTGTWEADEKTIQSSGVTVKSRRGLHGNTCYEPFRREQPKESLKHAYEVKGNELVIHHKDPVMKGNGKGNPAYHGCDDGSELLFVFSRQ